MYDKYGNFAFTVIGLSFTTFVLPLIILLISPILIYTVFFLITNILPIEFIPFKPNENLHQYFSGFLWGIAFIPFTWNKSFEVDHAGNPRFIGFSLKKFIFTIIILTLIFEFLKQLLFPDQTYWSLITGFMDWSNEKIELIISYTNSEYLDLVLPLVPIAVLSFIAVKYLIYLLIIWFLKLIWMFIILSTHLQQISI